METEPTQDESLFDASDLRTEPNDNGSQRSSTIGGRTDVQWWLLAAERGDPAAMEELGDRAEEHQSEINGLSATEWFLRASQAGSATAATKLGRMASPARDADSTPPTHYASQISSGLVVPFRDVRPDPRLELLFGIMTRPVLAELHQFGLKWSFSHELPRIGGGLTDLVGDLGDLLHEDIQRIAIPLHSGLQRHPLQIFDADFSKPLLGGFFASTAPSDLVEAEEGAADDPLGPPPSNSVGTIELLDSMIEAARHNLSRLEELRELHVGRSSEPSPGAAIDTEETVTLKSPTGTFDYTLPFTVNDSYGSSELSSILSPTDRPHRSLVQARRQANELLGVQVGNQYRYPKFQIDAPRRRIRPAAAYANKLLEASLDPWGALTWWYEENNDFGDRRPVDLVGNDSLDVNEIERSLGDDRRGMD